MTAFVFDLDGTLIDSRGSIARACNHALVELGRPAQPVEVISTYVGDGARTLLARAFGVERAAPILDEALDAFVRFYAENPLEGTTWMPGALEVLDRLAGAPLAVVTNKARAATLPVLRALGIEARFGAIVAGGDYALKPDPAPILGALRALGAEARDAWVVGDGIQDVRAGKAAGTRTAAVLGGFTSDARLLAEAPDVVLASLLELPARLLG